MQRRKKTRELLDALHAGEPTGTKIITIRARGPPSAPSKRRAAIFPLKNRSLVAVLLIYTPRRHRSR